MDQSTHALRRYYVHQIQALQKKVKELELENHALVNDLNASIHNDNRAATE